MHHLSKDFVTAVVPSIDSLQKEALRDFLCAHWKVDRVEFFFVKDPDVFFSHGVRDETAHRLISRLVNSLGWQRDRRLAVVSHHSPGIFTEGEQRQLLSKALVNLKKILTQVELQGVLLTENKPLLLNTGLTDAQTQTVLCA